MSDMPSDPLAAFVYLQLLQPASMTTYWGICPCGTVRECNGVCQTCQSALQLPASFPGGYPDAPEVAPADERWHCPRCFAIYVCNVDSECADCNGAIT